MKKFRFKKFIALIWDIIFKKKEMNPNEQLERTRIILFGSAFLATISLILSIMNVMASSWSMLVTTLILFAGFSIAFLITLLTKKTLISSIIIVLITAILFSAYILRGGNNGFAALWVLLVPMGAMYLIGLKYGLLISLYFQLYLIALFYIPFLREFVEPYYNSTFLNRFPIFYLATFIGSSALFIQKEHYYNKTMNVAYDDELTNLKNRLFFKGMLKKYNDANSYMNLVVAQIDLNRLKFLNDNFGHDCGDEALIAVADCMMKVWGPPYQSDENNMVVLARTGGDEFSILALKDVAVFMDEVNQFKKAIDEYPEINTSKIAVSLGIAARIEVPDANALELIKLADRRMYEDKNRFYISSGFDRRNNN